MKHIPKKFLGFWVIVLTVSLFFFLTRDSVTSQITVSSQENIFNIDFNLNPSDKNNLSRFIKNLQLPEDITEDLSFELDSVSTTALTLISPININPTIQPKLIKFEGKTSHSLFNKKLAPKKIKIPTIYNLAIFAPNHLDFVLSKSIYPNELTTWLRANLGKEEGQYLVIFSQTADFFVATPSTNIDLNELQEIFADQQFYKQETRDNTTFHFLNISATSEQSETIAFFKNENFTIFASSREAALVVADALNSKNSTQFPSFNYDNNSNFILSFSNNDDKAINEDFVKLIGNQIVGGSNANLLNFLQKVKELNFALSVTDFSGLISLK